MASKVCCFLVCLACLMVAGPIAGAMAAGDAPVVVATSPANGATGVDPALAEISVTFDRPMQDGNWSWCYENVEDFPKLNGSPHYLDGRTTNVLPVLLEPGKTYVIWINAETYMGFKDEAGTPVAPYKFTFATQ